MTDLKYKIKVMQHFADGGKVESRFLRYGEDALWMYSYYPQFNWSDFDYRIKEQSNDE